MINGRLCILGAGHMGRALIGGLLRAGVPNTQLSVGESDAAARAAALRDFGVSATDDNRTAVAAASIVVLAVRPQDAASVLRPLAAVFARTPPLLVSVAAGVRIASLEAWCGPGVPVMRAMPNRPARIGAGATGVYAPASIDAGRRAEAERVLLGLGEVFWVAAEELLDVVTALSGSGPAYFFLLAELMAEAAEGLGLESGTARRLAAATLYGSGLLVRGGEGDLPRLRQEITSAGGTTEAALRVLEAADLRGTVRAALAAATQRGRELAAPQAS
jgi:pyrroline-5-carboxylate reductase